MVHTYTATCTEQNPNVPKSEHIMDFMCLLKQSQTDSHVLYRMRQNKSECTHKLWTLFKFCKNSPWSGSGLAGLVAGRKWILGKMMNAFSTMNEILNTKYEIPNASAT